MELEILDDKIIVHSRMVPALSTVVPRLEGQRRWSKDGKQLVCQRTGHNEALLRAVPGMTLLNVADTTVFQSTGGDSGRPRYSPLTQAYAHQQQAAQAWQAKRHFALFMEQGTGKTKVCLDHAGQLWADGKIDCLLVVAPKGVHRQWVASQIPMHLGCPSNTAYWPISMEEAGALNDADKLNILTINVDALRTPRGKNVVTEFLSANGHRAMMVIDESHTIKNHTSARWKACKEIGQTLPYRCIMTGTPIAKNLLDEWSQFQWLDENIIGIKYVTTFKKNYCIMGGFNGRQIVGHYNVDDFKSKVEPYYFRVTKDALVLPKQRSLWEFDITREQKELYRNMKNDLIAQIKSGEITSAANAAVGMMRLQQISNGFIVDENENIQRLFPKALDNPRIAAAMDYIEATEGKIIIWARFNEDVAMLLEALNEVFLGQAVAYVGRTSNKDRDAAVEKFLTDPNTRFFVSNPMAGGVGLNLQGECTNALYYSNSDNSIARWQSEDRIHRIGTTGVCVYTDLSAPGTLDAKIRRSLNDKKALSEMALTKLTELLEDEAAEIERQGIARPEDNDQFANIHD